MIIIHYRKTSFIDKNKWLKEKWGLRPLEVRGWRGKAKDEGKG
jgi:hypothetical protein